MEATAAVAGEFDCEWEDAAARPCVCVVCHRKQRVPTQRMCQVKMREEFVVTYPAGPGTELKEMLADFGFSSFEGCKCNSLVNRMNRWGPDGCRQPDNKQTVLAELRFQAKLKNVTLYDNSVGEALIEEACRRAEEKAAATS